MVKQIEVCDICEKASTTLKPYSIPYPEEIVAYGGRCSKTFFETKGTRSKRVLLCHQCAEKVSHEIWQAFGRLRMANEINLKSK